MAAYTTIDDPSAYFKVQLWTGTGSSNAVAFNDTDTTMQPDLVWIKQRDDAVSPFVFDSVRGATKWLKTDTTTAEGTDANSLTAFGSDGFTVGTGTSFNDSSQTYVAWCWKESADSGMDIVTYTGTGSAKTESHSLSAVPEFITVRVRSETGHWRAYHGSNTSAPETDALIMNDTDATYDWNVYWNDTAPTSSVFTVGTHDQTNKNTATYVAYLWRSVQGFSKFGSYTGNGNADGPFVYTGFKPALVVVKRSNSTGSWNVFDNKREGFNPDNSNLYWNTTSAEQTDSDRTNPIDFLSNGFKLRGTDTDVNGSDDTYIYMAWAESPFVNSNGVPNNAE